MAEPIVVGGERGGPDRRRVLMLAGAGALVLLAVVVLPGLLFGGGGGTSTDEAFPPPPAGGSSVATPPTEPPPPETFETFSTKNPFKPLVSTSPAGSSTPSADPEPELSGGQPLPPPDGFDDGFFPDAGPGFFPDLGAPTDGTSTEGGTTPTTTPAPPPRQPDRVSLLEVFTDQAGRLVASVRVNDITHLAGEGDDFATSYRVLDLDADARCGRFLFGDDRFSLCEGDETFR